MEVGPQNRYSLADGSGPGPLYPTLALKVEFAQPDILCTIVESLSLVKLGECILR